MEIEKGIKNNMEMVEKEVETDSKKMSHPRRGGIRTLPFILGELNFILISLC